MRWVDISYRIGDNNPRVNCAIMGAIFTGGALIDALDAGGIIGGAFPDDAAGGGGDALLRLEDCCGIGGGREPDDDAEPGDRGA